MVREYIVNKDILNIRSKPSDESDDTFRGQLLKGSRVWVHENDIIGVIPKGGVSNIWKSRTDDPNFVSADGLRPITYQDKKTEFIKDAFNQQFIDTTDPENEDKWKVSWGHVDLEIWKIWRDYKVMGENVKIAVIDTGCNYNLNDLKGQIDITNSYSYFTFDNNVFDQDADIHGTKSSGIIAANGKNVQTVYGVAPESKLILIQLFNRSEGLPGYNPSNFSKALEKVRDNKIDIISMSFCTTHINDELNKQISLCIKDNILLTASVGDVNQNQGLVNEYPAYFNDVFSIGAYKLFNNERRIYDEFSSQSDHLKLLAPGKDILTAGLGNQRTLHQYSSAAAPFVAGIFALIISYRKKMGLPVSPQIFDSKIPLACQKINNGLSYDPKEGYGILNAYKFFQLLTI